MTFYEQFDKIWVCDECNGALTEETLRSIKEQRMLKKCPRCGKNTDEIPIEAYPETNQESGWIEWMTERFK